MDGMFTYVRQQIWGKTPADHKKEATKSINEGKKELRKQLRGLEFMEKKTIISIKNLNGANALTPAQKRANAMYLGAEVVRARRQKARLETSEAQLDSIKSQVDQQFAVRRIHSTMKDATAIMRTVNGLVRIPELTKPMRQLSETLVAAGVIDEMVEDMLPDGQAEIADEATEAEIAKLVDQTLGPRFVRKLATEEPQEQMPSVPVEPQPEPAQPVGSDEQRLRLQALKT